MCQPISIANRDCWSVQAQTQLRDLVAAKSDYLAISHALAAVTQLSEPLQPLRARIESVSTMLRSIQDSRAAVKEMVAAELDGFFLLDEARRTTDRRRISEACLVVDALGHDFRAHVIERYVLAELKEYKRIFSFASSAAASNGSTANDKEAAQLDNASRRYAWFRRALKSHDDESASVFPETWKVAQVLTVRFAEVTK